MFIKSSGCQYNYQYIYIFGINYKNNIVELKKSQIHQYNKRQRETICNQYLP